MPSGKDKKAAKAARAAERDREEQYQRHYRLVRQAITSGTAGCFEWDPEAASNARSACEGLEPSYIKQLAIEHVRNGGAVSPQLQDPRERDRHGREFDHYYSICFEVDGIDGRIYIKVILFTDDDEMPVARIVVGHRSSFH